MFGIMRIEKRKIQATGGLEAEANRDEKDADKFPNSDIDAAKTSENVFLKKTDGWREEINKQIKEAGLKARKDAITLLDGLYTASPEYFENKSKDEIIAYFEECKKFHIEQYCKGDESRLINAVIHFDEKTPHMQIASIPIYEDEKGFHLSAKSIMGNIKAYKVRQDKFYDEVCKKRGFERGEVEKYAPTAKKHKHKRQWELEQVTAQLNTATQQLNEQKYYINALKSNIDTAMSIFLNSEQIKRDYNLSLRKPISQPFEAYRLLGLTIMTPSQSKQIENVVRARNAVDNTITGINLQATNILQKVDELSKIYKQNVDVLSKNMDTLQQIETREKALRRYSNRIDKSLQLQKQNEKLDDAIRSKQEAIKELQAELKDTARSLYYEMYARRHKEDFNAFVEEVNENDIEKTKPSRDDDAR